MSDKPDGDLISYAITETFGERCPDHEETCPCCKAWEQYDARESYANLINIIADIREKSGVGGKPMLGELADAIEARMAAAEQRGAERERERIANLCDDFVKTGTILWAKEDDPDRAALHLAQAYGVRSLAAAIRRGEG